MARPKNEEKVEEVSTEELMEVINPKPVDERVALSNVKISDNEFAIMRLTFDMNSGKLLKMERASTVASQPESFNAFKLEAFKQKFV